MKEGMDRRRWRDATPFFGIEKMLISIIVSLFLSKRKKMTPIGALEKCFSFLFQLMMEDAT